MKRALLVAGLALALATAARAGTGPRTFDLPAWSPDGASVAWADEPFGGADAEAEIWTAAADGSGAAPLLRGFRNGLFELVWTASNTLLFDANFQVFRATPDGRYRHVTPPTGSTFATDARGTRVASACDRCNGPVFVWSLTGGPTAKLGGKGVTGGDPSLSPDGARIVFNRAVVVDAKNGVWRGQGLWIARTDGRSLRRLATIGYCASWSPDGGAIAYDALVGTHLQLRVVAPDGSHDRLLLERGPVCSVPASLAWSPDGTRLALRFNRRLDVLDLATRTIRAIQGTAGVTGMAWSPDGTKILVTAPKAGSSCASLWLAQADGSGTTLLRDCGSA